MFTVARRPGAKVANAAYCRRPFGSLCTFRRELPGRRVQLLTGGPPKATAVYESGSSVTVKAVPPAAIATGCG
jgi:hypothetical protein